MKRKRYAALLVLLLLLGGCAVRGVTELIPIPTPPPTPTPCPHNTWVNGICADCGLVCPHESRQNGFCLLCGDECSHQWSEGFCVLCGTPCSHQWEEGVCALCGLCCPHEWDHGVCTVCDLRCSHPSHDGESCLCPVCGGYVRHRFFNSVCSLCGASPVFNDEGVPEEFMEKCEHPGTVEHITYMTHNHFRENNPNNEEYEKRLSVYLPYGYDPEKQYDMVVLLHGMGNMEEYWLDIPHEYNDDVPELYTADVLDNMIDRGLCPPVIVVCPTFYKDSVILNEYLAGSDFTPELREDILPCVLERYSTYAPEPTIEGMSAVREHFAFVGLSMGSIICYQTAVTNCPDLFGYYGAFSGMSTYPQSVLANINREEYADLPFYYLFNCAGQGDVMLDDHRYFLNQLFSLTDRFVLDKNASFVLVKNCGHEYRTWITGLYDCLQVFFSFTD